MDWLTSREACIEHFHTYVEGIFDIMLQQPPDIKLDEISPQWVSNYDLSCDGTTLFIQQYALSPRHLRFQCYSRVCPHEILTPDISKQVETLNYTGRGLCNASYTALIITQDTEIKFKFYIPQPEPNLPNKLDYELAPQNTPSLSALDAFLV